MLKNLKAFLSLMHGMCFHTLISHVLTFRGFSDYFYKQHGNPMAAKFYEIRYRKLKSSNLQTNEKGILVFKFEHKASKLFKNTRRDFPLCISSQKSFQTGSKLAWNITYRGILKPRYVYIIERIVFRAPWTHKPLISFLLAKQTLN